MKRRVFNFAAGVSLVLCLATGALWVRGCRHVDHVTWWRSTSVPGQQGWLFAVAGHGGVGVGRYVYSAPAVVEKLEWNVNRTTEGYAGGGWTNRSLLNRLGFYAIPLPLKGTDRLDAMAAPVWFILLLTAVLPGWRLLIWQRDGARRKDHLCAACGYDLRATPDRCPECGTVPEQAIVAPIKTD